MTPKELKPMMTQAVRHATIDAGIAAVKQWQRGETAYLDEWAKMYLTPKGAEVLTDLTRTLDHQQIYTLVQRAVDAGY